MLPYALDQAEKKILLIRHGQAGGASGKRYIGQTETELTSQGLAQARALADWLMPVPIERIVCSDLIRSVQTARILAKAKGQPIEPDSGLREIFLGSWEGLPMALVKEEDPQAYEQRGRDLAGYRPPGGESFADLQSRVVPVIRDILAQATGPVAIVGHAGVNRVMLCHWMGLPLDRLFSLGQDPGGVSIVQPTPKGDVRLVALNVLLGSALPPANLTYFLGQSAQKD
ncbi:MAG: histidine phosphatase family protein [Desulfovermiculus sp.]|nr:histidine phosphatase family protein [Desulfovermiculus sp.]